MKTTWFVLALVFVVASAVEFFTRSRLNTQLLLLALGWIAYTNYRLEEK